MAFIRTTTFRNHQNRFSGRHYKEQGGEEGRGGGGGGVGGDLPGYCMCGTVCERKGEGVAGGWRGGVAGDCLRARSRSNTALHGLETHHDNPGRGL